LILKAGIEPEAVSWIKSLTVFCEVNDFLPPLCNYLLPFFVVSFPLLEKWQALRFDWKVK